MAEKLAPHSGHTTCTCASAAAVVLIRVAADQTQRSVATACEEIARERAVSLAARHTAERPVP
jgi:hypothetical protein